MTLQYGFELEGFACDTEGIVIPADVFPVDGFPGLVELRTSGPNFLRKALMELFGEYMRVLALKRHMLTFDISEHKFSGKELAELRRTRTFEKDYLDIRNLYGKEPRALNGRTLASFQINISKQVQWEQKQEAYDKNGNRKDWKQDNVFSLPDIARAVRGLDKEFAEEIKRSNRQAGMYAIKKCEGGQRLEYRSLPNFIFVPVIERNSGEELLKLEERITKALKDV